MAELNHPGIVRVLERLFSSIETKDGRVKLWREIPAGEGWIGSPEGESEWDDERPRHKVTITKPFRMMVVPVTKAMNAAADRKYGKDQAELPAVDVSWDNAMKFCAWLAETFAWAKGARLPTEEEWEYACRAGTKTRYWSGDSEQDLARVGWYDDNSGGRTHRVGEKPANPWGLYDMHGNVWEWTLSKWKADYSGQKDGLEVDPAAISAGLAAASPRGEGRVVRGGSFGDAAYGTRAANRGGFGPGLEDGGLAFRVLLPAPPELGR